MPAYPNRPGDSSHGYFCSFLTIFRAASKRCLSPTRWPSPGRNIGRRRAPRQLPRAFAGRRPLGGNPRPRATRACRISRPLPVLSRQPGNPAELLHVVRHQGVPVPKTMAAMIRSFGPIGVPGLPDAPGSCRVLFGSLIVKGERSELLPERRDQGQIVRSVFPTAVKRDRRSPNDREQRQTLPGDAAASLAVTFELGPRRR